MTPESCFQGSGKNRVRQSFCVFVKQKAAQQVSIRIPSFALLLRSPPCNLDDWLQAHDKKQYTTAVFIDLSKAFDNVLHEHLLLTLQACGVSGTALRWFRNFLYDRQQRVVVNNKSSSFFTCNKGVPKAAGSLDHCCLTFMWQTCHHLQGSMEPRCHRLPMI